MILVVGAAGQLGSRIVRKLSEAGQPTRAFVRTTSNYAALQNLPNVEVAFGDLKDAASVANACKDVTAVISTANVVIPSRKDYSFQKDEGDGHKNLVAACKQEGVRQFILASVPVTPIDQRIPTNIFKRQTEKALIDSGVPYTIFRLSIFLDSWLVLIGGSTPLRGGGQNQTVQRKFWFSNLYLSIIGGMIEKRGLAVLTGNGTAKHAFVTLDDVASMMIGAIQHPAMQCRIVEVGGPQILSWRELLDIYGKVIGRKIRIVSMPTPVAAVLQSILGLISPAAANIMGLNRLVTYNSAYDMSELSQTFGIKLKTAEEFLREKTSASPTK
jgi:uncharacterized protein YbjT (DUF2867 family)